MTIYDEDQNGVISKEELLKFALTKARAEGRTSEQHRQQIQEVVNKITTFIDTNSDGGLSKEELIKAIQRDPSLKKVL
jgi:Ca2+-binding EF-hand superfamily protein